MTVLTEEIYNTRLSVNERIKIGDMNKDAKEFYLAIYSLYMNLMYQYLMKKTEIVNYDKQLIDKDFKSIDEEYTDFYQMFSEGFLKFFYIRNNLYLDRLTNEEIEFLGSKLAGNNYALDRQAEELIERTYRKLIFENVSGNYDSSFDVNFGPDSMKFYAPVNSFVIGVRYDEELINGCDDKSIEKYLTKRNFVEELCLELSEKLSEILNMPVSVIYYNNNSIKKKHNANDSFNKYI